MHQKNIHKGRYDLEKLAKNTPPLRQVIYTSEYGEKSIDFSHKNSIYLLNKALLAYHYKIEDWVVPEGFLVPPVPGRADYIHHISDLLEGHKNENILGLDVGVGASCIYPLLALKIYNWNMIGCDINSESVSYAKKNSLAFKEKIEIRFQNSRSNIFEGILHKYENVDFTMCNPPFYDGVKEAKRSHSRRVRNLHLKDEVRIYGGHSDELWCNGGELLFVKRMIKESVRFKDQVGWFTTLISKGDNLRKLEKLLYKKGASLKVIQMKHGNKKSRILAWRF